MGAGEFDESDLALKLESHDHAIPESQRSAAPVFGKKRCDNKKI
jgi:hypothetical protein